MKVELRLCFRWVCPICESINFEFGIPAELNQEERMELQENHGLVANPGDYMVMPDEVTCRCCHSTSEVDLDD